MQPRLMPTTRTSSRRRNPWVRIGPWLGLVAALALPLPAAETWVKVTADRFTVLSPAGEAVARKWATELAQFRHGLQAIVPVDEHGLRPVTVVLFPNDAAMQPYVPLEGGRPARVAGYFVRLDGFNTIMLSLARNEGEVRHLVYHEASHWHTGALLQEMPPWLSEGLAELYATFELADDRTFRFGAALPGHVRQLAAGKLLPVRELVATGRNSLLYNEEARTNIFYAQSWALAHLLVLSAGSPGPAGINRYLALLKQGRPEAEAFATAFGGTQAEFEGRLRRYVRSGAYPRATYAYAGKLESATGSAASPVEVAVAQAALLAGTRDAATAEQAIRRAAELGPQDPRPWELLGVVTATQALKNLDPKLMDSAAEHFRRSIALGPKHAPAYEGFAGMAYGRATVTPADRELLLQGLVASPGNLVIAAGLGAVEIRLGRVAEGRERLSRVRAVDPTGTARGPQYARRILDREDFKAELAEIDLLARANRLPEALAILERSLARDLDPVNRQVAVSLRQMLGGAASPTAAAPR